LNIWWCTIRQLKCENSQAPNIRFVIILFFSFANNFRCHPANSSHFADRLSSLGGQLRRVTKIRQFYISLTIEQNIITFYISVDNSSGVKIEKALESFSQDICNNFFVNISLFLADAGKSSEIHNLYDDPEFTRIIKSVETFDN
jgi:hypothetical protein